MNYREISKEANMNYTTARQHFCKAIEKIAFEISRKYNPTLSKKEIKKISQNIDFQNAILELAQQINSKK